MYILLAIPATYKHHLSGIETSHTQKRYNLSLHYEEILQTEPPKSRQLSFKDPHNFM